MHHYKQKNLKNFFPEVPRENVWWPLKNVSPGLAVALNGPGNLLLEYTSLLPFFYHKRIVGLDFVDNIGVHFVNVFSETCQHSGDGRRFRAWTSENRLVIRCCSLKSARRWQFLCIYIGISVNFRLQLVSWYRNVISCLLRTYFSSTIGAIQKSCHSFFD